VTVEHNVGDMTELMQKLAADMHPLAARRAANRTRDRIVTNVRKVLSAEHGIPAAAVTRKRVIKGKTATPRAPTASFRVGQWAVPVTKFGKPRALKRGGVAYKTVGGSQTDPSAFVVASLGGNVFNRAPGAGRLPIKRKSADIAPAVEAALTSVASDSAVGDIFERELRSTLDYRVNQEVAKWRRAK
jgi:hypothetical protein